MINGFRAVFAAALLALSSLIVTKFVKDFVAAWTKVMSLDRFDLHA